MNILMRSSRVLTTLLMATVAGGALAHGGYHGGGHGYHRGHVGYHGYGHRGYVHGYGHRGYYGGYGRGYYGGYGRGYYGGYGYGNGLGWGLGTAALVGTTAAYYGSTYRCGWVTNANGYSRKVCNYY